MKLVSFKSKHETIEIQRNRSIEIKQCLKNLIKKSQKKINIRFPNGTQEYIDVKLQILENNENLTNKEVNERLSFIDQCIQSHELLERIIEDPVKYIQNLDNSRRNDGNIESKK
jgi:hypothetical protein